MSSNIRDQAIDLMRQQRYREASPLFRQLISDDPQHWLVLYMAGQCCRFVGDLKSAIAYLRQATTINNEEPAALLAFRIALQLDGQLPAAVDAFVRAINISL